MNASTKPAKPQEGSQNPSNVPMRDQGGMQIEQENNWGGGGLK